jgi:Fe-S cluster biogenesis protein NfuA
LTEFLNNGPICHLIGFRYPKNMALMRFRLLQKGNPCSLLFKFAAVFILVSQNKKILTMIQTGNPVISIYTEMTPNPETMKFVANKLLYPGKSIDFAEESLAAPSPLAKELFSFPFIKSVFIASNFITLTKTADTDDWQDVIPPIKTFLKEYLENGGVVVNDEEVAKVKQESTNTVSEDDDDIVKRVKELLENYVKPAVEMDGGAIQFKSYNDGIVNLMLQGSCSGCPSSMITLKAGIEGMMKRMIPEVREVVAEAE